MIKGRECSPSDIWCFMRLEILYPCDVENLLGVLLACTLDHFSEDRRACDCGIIWVYNKQFKRMLELGHSSIIEDKNLIIVCDRIESVGDGKNAARSKFRSNGLLNHLVCFKVYICSCLIEYDYFILLHHRTCETNKLLLSLGEHPRYITLKKKEFFNNCFDILCNFTHIWVETLCQFSYPSI